MIDEITCVFFQNGQETDVPRADVLAPFKSFVKETEEISTQLVFPDGGEAELDIDDAMRVSADLVEEFGAPKVVDSAEALKALFADIS